MTQEPMCEIIHSQCVYTCSQLDVEYLMSLKRLPLLLGTSHFNCLRLIDVPPMPAIDAIPKRFPHHVKVKSAGGHGLE